MHELFHKKALTHYVTMGGGGSCTKMWPRSARIPLLCLPPSPTNKQKKWVNSSPSKYQDPNFQTKQNPSKSHCQSTPWDISKHTNAHTKLDQTSVPVSYFLIIVTTSSSETLQRLKFGKFSLEDNLQNKMFLNFIQRKVAFQQATEWIQGPISSLLKNLIEVPY